MEGGWLDLLAAHGMGVGDALTTGRSVLINPQWSFTREQIAYCKIYAAGNGSAGEVASVTMATMDCAHIFSFANKSI